MENSWETSGAWILHWGGFLGKMLCICLCLQSTWPPLSLLPLCSLPASEEVLLLSAESPHQNKRQTVWGPFLPASVTCRAVIFTPTTQTQGAWAQKRDTKATSDEVGFDDSDQFVTWTQAAACSSHVRPVSESGLKWRKRCSVTK